MAVISLLWMLLQDAVVASVPAIGFAMLFNVPKKALMYCGFAGALAHSIRLLLLHQWGIPIALGTLLVSFLVGSLGMYWSRRHLIPVQVYTVAAIIPMIPGKYAFTSMVGIVQMGLHQVTPDIVERVLSNALITLFILGAIALGLAVPRLVFYREKPVV